MKAIRYFKWGEGVTKPTGTSDNFDNAKSVAIGDRFGKLFLIRDAYNIDKRSKVGIKCILEDKITSFQNYYILKYSVAITS